jgi:hypothetical protein
MSPTKYELVEVVFQKCPICGKGTVQKMKPTGFFSFAQSEKISCPNCNVIFSEEETTGEKMFKLDLSESKMKSKYDGETLSEREWKNGISDLDFCVKNNKLPQTHISGLKTILQSDEQSHWYSSTKLMEERAVRNTAYSGVRLMKGVYVGGSKGESHGELRTIDSGSLLLTNKRLIFTGGFRSIEYRLDKIISIEEYEDAIEIGASNRQKVQTYVVDDPHKWSVYVKIAIQNISQPKRGKSESIRKQEIKDVIENNELDERNENRSKLDKLFEEGKQLMKDYRYKEAEKKFKDAIAIKKYGYLFCALGDLYYKLERYDEAINTYKDALKVEPDIPYPKRAIEKIQRKLLKKNNNYNQNVKYQMR